MRYRSHFNQHILALLIRRRGLGMQHKRYSEETFDPFYELIPPVRLECVLDSVAGGHRWLGRSFGMHME